VSNLLALSVAGGAFLVLSEEKDKEP